MRERRKKGGVTDKGMSMRATRRSARARTRAGVAGQAHAEAEAEGGESKLDPTLELRLQVRDAEKQQRRQAVEDGEEEGQQQQQQMHAQEHGDRTAAGTEEDEEDEEDLAMRFQHLLQPIRDLAQNWDMDIATSLEEYLEELESITVSLDGGETQLNFAEAALVIQGTTCVYSKKVEYLYNLVLQTLDVVSMQQRQRRRVGEGADGDGDSDGEEAGGRRRRGAGADESSELLWDDDPAFLPLDDMIEERHDIDLRRKRAHFAMATSASVRRARGGRRSSFHSVSSRRASRVSVASNVSRTSMLLVASLMRDGDTAASAQRGSSSLRMSKCSVHTQSGALLFGGTSVAGDEPLLAAAPTDVRVNLGGAHGGEGQGLHDDDDDGAGEYAPLGAGMHSMDDGDDYVPEAGDMVDFGDDNEHGIGGSPGRLPPPTPNQQLQLPPQAQLEPEDDVWMLLDPHDVGDIASRPVRVGRTYEQPVALQQQQEQQQQRRRRQAGGRKRTSNQMSTRTSASTMPMMETDARLAGLSCASFKEIVKGQRARTFKRRLQAAAAASSGATRAGTRTSFATAQLYREVWDMQLEDAREEAAHAGMDDAQLEEEALAIVRHGASASPGAGQHMDDDGGDMPDYDGGGADMYDYDGDGGDPGDHRHDLFSTTHSTQPLSLDDAFNDCPRTYEDLCRRHIEDFMQGAERYAHETQLTRRVHEWQHKLETILEEQELREVFDIHECGDRIIEALELSAPERQGDPAAERRRRALGSRDPNAEDQGDDGDSDAAQLLLTGPRKRGRDMEHLQREDLVDGHVHMEFTELTSGLDAFEVSRLFVSSLQLAADGNVRIDGLAGANFSSSQDKDTGHDGALDDFNLTLLDTDKGVNIAGYRAPSLQEHEQQQQQNQLLL